MEQMIEQCLYSILVVADDCEAECEPDRARLLRTCARFLEDEIQRYESAIQKTIDENGHLADGDNCTLIHLVRAMKTPNDQASGARSVPLDAPVGREED